ncbi:MAG: CoA pyrophosphatase [Pseudorhodoplanes sp.]
MDHPVSSPQSLDFFERARARLSFKVPQSLTDADILPERGDYEAEPSLRMIADVRPIRPAAVLIPVVAHPEPTVLLTKRTSHLSDHAGQVAFPGGRIDPEDTTPLAAALREAHEEIGLQPDFIEPIGYLDVYMTTRGYRILPSLARVRPGFTLTLSPDEVESAFEVPLSFLMEGANHQRHRYEWKGMMRSYYAMPFEDRYIWGITAGIVRDLYERIYRG